MKGREENSRRTGSLFFGILRFLNYRLLVVLIDGNYMGWYNMSIKIQKFGVNHVHNADEKTDSNN